MTNLTEKEIYKRIEEIYPNPIDAAHIKQTCAKDLTPAEFLTFVKIAHKLKLCPMTRQIYALKMSGRVFFHVGIDGYRAIADRTNRYAPGKEEVIYKDGKVFEARVWVKKMTADGTWHEFCGSAIYSEYRGRGPIWQDKPSIMLKKCAEALALRRAFPDAYMGVYVKEELDQLDETIIEPDPPKLKTITDEQIEMIKNAAGNDKNILRQILAINNLSKLSDISNDKVDDILNQINQLNPKSCSLNAPITDEQLGTIYEITNGKEKAVQKILEIYKKTDLDQLTQKDYEEIMAKYEAQKAKRNGGNPCES